MFLYPVAKVTDEKTGKVTTMVNGCQNFTILYVVVVLRFY